MTPLEKAQELVDRMDRASDEDSTRIAKSCALVCVDELIENVKSFYSLDVDWNDGEQIEYDEYFWTQVKQELENL